MAKDFYELLGVKANASDAELKQAYRHLVAQYHPDKHEGNALQDLAKQRLAKLNEAWDVLSDPRKRALYDQQRRSGGSASPFSRAGGPFAGAARRGPFKPENAPPRWLAPVVTLLMFAGFGVALRLLKNPRVFFIVAGVTIVIWVVAVRRRKKRRR